jgi:hypothetical protein
MRALSPSASSTRPSNPASAAPFSVRSEASVRDSVRILAEIVTHLNERIELLEARDVLHRAR